MPRCKDAEEGPRGRGDDTGDLRDCRDGGGEAGRLGSDPDDQHGVRGAAQRDGPQPQRAEGAEELLLLEGLVDPSGGELLQPVQRQLLLAGAHTEGRGRPRSDTGHDGEVGGSRVDANGVAQATGCAICVGHDPRNRRRRNEGLRRIRRSARRSAPSRLMAPSDRRLRRTLREHPDTPG